MSAVALWFAGLLGLVIAAAVASGRARREPADVVGRGVIAIAAIAYAAIVITSAWTWGATSAAQGRASLLASGAPVTLLLEEARLPVTGVVSIGHGERAGVRVPDAGADEIARIEPTGPRLVVRPSAPTTIVVSVPTGDDPVRVASQRRCPVSTVARDARNVRDAGHDVSANASAAPTVDVAVGASAVIIECDGPRPVRAEVLTHAAAGTMGIAPLVWRGRFEPQRLRARAGDVLRVGAGEQVPGLASWETIGLRDASAIVAVPHDPTDCAAWSPDGRAGARADSACVVEVGAFTFLAIPRLPDAAGVLARGLRAGLVIGAPALLVLVVLVAMPRRRRRATGFARALCLAALGAVLTALACWRLLWAHRIDALHESGGAGALLADNELAVIAIGAALAALASRIVARVWVCATPCEQWSYDVRTWFVPTHDSIDSRREIDARRESRGAVSDLVIGALTWAVWFVVGWTVMGLGGRVLDLRMLGTLALSLIAGSLPALVRAGGILVDRRCRARSCTP